MMIGDSMAGFSHPISESSNAIAPSNSKRTSMNILFSASDRKLVPICMLASHSGINREPRGTICPREVCGWSPGPRLTGESELIPPLGLTPPGSETFAG